MVEGGRRKEGGGEEREGGREGYGEEKRTGREGRMRGGGQRERVKKE